MDKTLSPIHLGEVHLEDFMKSLKLTQYRLAKGMGVPSLRIK
jgi:plasmid maintenance system antidote protein VapI